MFKLWPDYYLALRSSKFNIVIFLNLKLFKPWPTKLILWSLGSIKNQDRNILSENCTHIFISRTAVQHFFILLCIKESWHSFHSKLLKQVSLIRRTGSVLKIRLIGENLYLQDTSILFKMLHLLCIWLHKVALIRVKPIVARVSDVVSGPIVIYTL